MQIPNPAYKICVLIPTYNNDKTLQRVLDGVLQYTKDVIVVNDGSTDTTAQILAQYSQINVLTSPKNLGKGIALQMGFTKAKDFGFDYVITIDSDGQHYPNELPIFFDEIKQSTAPVLLIGSRNMNQDTVPKKSNFGNNFSNFWFKVETGVALSDTQSGYRAYPLNYIPKKFFTSKFEFEIEVIVRTAWNGVAVKNIPIQVLYDPTERVSHFRPFLDFTRISILNTALVTILFVYIKPRNLIQTYRKKSLKQFIKNEILASHDSPKTKALSIALGIFIGLSPFWGFHLALSIGLAMFFKLNKVITFAFSNISIAPMIPFILFASLWIGNKIHPAHIRILSLHQVTFESIKHNLLQYILGSFVLAITGAIAAGLVSYLFFNIKFKKAK